LTGRPQDSEATPYYFRYIDQVAGEDLLTALDAQWEVALEVFAAISEDKSLHCYAPGKWSLRQVLSHVTDTERAMAFRALWFGRGFESALPSFDQEIAVAGALAERITWAAHVDEFRRVRLSTMALLQNMPDEAWARGGIASDHFVTVRGLAWIIAGHLAHHIALIRDRYL
jgi:hypothetical protein